MKDMLSAIRFFSKHLVVALALTMLFGGIASAKTTIILTHNMPTDHMNHTVSMKFQEKLKEISGDEFNVQYHPGGTLGDWTALMDQVMSGAIHMNFGQPASELDPRLDVGNFGFVVDNWKDGRRVYGLGGSMDKLYKNIFADLGLSSLGTVPTGFTGFVVRKGQKIPVNVPEDAKGFKMRVPPFRMAIDRYKALGFSVVPMSFSEVYTALQTGAIDGRAYSPAHEVKMFADTLDAYVYTREHFEHGFLLCNTQWFNSLSKQDQAWIKEASDYALNYIWDNIEEMSTSWLDEVRSLGIKVVTLNPEQMTKYKKIVLDTEVPIMEKLLGKETVDAMFAEAAQKD